MGEPVAIESVLRLEILKRLTVWLEGTDVSGRYSVADGVTSMAGRVKRGRLIFGHKDPCPMLSILEVPIPLDQIASPPDSPYSSGTWELLIQGFAPEDHDHPTDRAHVLMAATKKRLAEVRRQNRFVSSDTGILGFKNSITGMRIGAGVVRPPDEISVKAYFWLNLALDIAEDLADPFTD